MSFLRIFFIITCFLLINPLAIAQPRLIETDQTLEQLIAMADQKKIYNNPAWLRLLHFRITPRIATHSDIISPEFFNAYRKGISTQQITAKQELFATLKAFYQKNTQTKKPHPQCRFPARFYWLKQQLPVSKATLPTVVCQRLNGWAKFKTLDSVSLIMVSGYFGNPASTFGHLLVKLNNSEFKPSSGNLLDQSINYGAKVPDNESIPVYIAKGIFGGYVSSFSEKTFYTQDLVYSKHEFRDMWEYELNLNQRQKKLLVYHLWEMLGMQSNYYFLKENCGYRIAELLELITGQQFTPDRQPWYLPLSVFQKLEAVEHSHYIKKITFLPSSQRQLYHAFNQLPDQQVTLVNNILANPERLKDKPFRQFTTQQQAEIVDVMLRYYQYKLSDTDLKEVEVNQLKGYKNQLLLSRLTLPILGKTKQKKQVTIISPAKGAKPRLFQVGIGYHKNKGTLGELGMTAIHYDLLTNSKGLLENAELKVFDLTLNYDKRQQLSLRKLDLIGIQKLGLTRTALQGESNRSWRVHVGFKDRQLACLKCTNFYLKGGIGQALALSDHIIAYGLLDAEFITGQKTLHLAPNLGFITQYSAPLKSVVELRSQINLRTGKQQTQALLEMRYSLSKNYTLRLSYKKAGAGEVKASFFHHW